MKPRALFPLSALLLFAAAAPGCAQAPEDFCKDWAAKTCETLSGCCVDGATFDGNGCSVGLTKACEDALDTEGVHSGEVVFDPGAASACYRTLASCDDIDGFATPDDEVTKACGRMITGHRPPGSGCSSDSECEMAGDFPLCHDGVCAKGIIATDHVCSFSFDTLELHVCPAGEHCDTSGLDYDPQASPSHNQWEFSAPCVAPLGQGAACVDQNGDSLGDCAQGLFCDYDFQTPENSTCTPTLPEGADCSMGGVCGAGLSCQGGGNATCQKVQRPYCWSPPVCGDGSCDDGEFQSCPQDCGGGGFCGDAFCDIDEDDVSCPEDCGGGAVCGDGTCDFQGTEPATCPQDCCGDGYCDPGETAQICPADCA